VSFNTVAIESLSTILMLHTKPGLLCTVLSLNPTARRRRGLSVRAVSGLNVPGWARMGNHMRSVRVSRVGEGLDALAKA